ncbi:hypothetical protein [Aneurinibacillus tyrosinisolvens]|uniref:hypothetical protein n=1 Tax=Aneurinibacillus tyrosinisolvens TaxID=1443435 RepID=UPI00063FCB8A|nr:hypothetical protein [Aneurinibacillus tyrosinisolvens]
MLNIRLAKSKMENEEGMNHLWVRIHPLSSQVLKHAQLTIHLPNGVYRSENLNGYFENKSACMLLGSISHELNIMIEIYTQQEIPCRKTEITVSLSYKDGQGQPKEMTSSIPLVLVSEDEMDDMKIDKEVISQLEKINERNADEGLVGFPLQTQYLTNELSSLEKKYRIDCAFF